MDWNTLIWAFLGGILPALVWLWFWLREDARHPEPKRLIFAAFAFGMLMVPIALFFEKIAHTYIASGILLIAVWAIIEELLKYAGAYIVAFRKVCLDGSRCLDEPVDPLIYLITVALGFSALENTLFLIGPLESGNMLVSLLTGNLRFIGATVLHVVASASIGVAMGFTFYKKRAQKKTYLLIGIFTAILLHALFNLFIIVNKVENIFVIFGFLWVAVIVLLVLFERIKRIKHNHV